MPEQLLEKLICNRVDYHFARIHQDTDLMTSIFKKVYDGAPAGATLFEMHVSDTGLVRRGKCWVC